ncbi:MAG: MaoC family dehydratase [Acidimicrobiales bacterium]|nr:MaoC family dehydratase [Acidimicrobiales bacterium]
MSAGPTASHPPQAGDALPELSVEMTATRIVAGAIATRDFMPVHHDRAYANSQGAPDIFMNILSTNAHCSRYLTRWAGPDAMVKRLSIRLGVPVFPGSTLTFTGSVTAAEQEDDELTVDVEFRASNELGDHATGTARLTLPTGG